MTASGLSESVIELYRYAETHGIAHRRCGKLVLAAEAGGLDRLRELQVIAEQCGVLFTLAAVSNPGYVPIINSSSLLDRAVSPHNRASRLRIRCLVGGM